MKFHYILYSWNLGSWLSSLTSRLAHVFTKINSGNMYFDFSIFKFSRCLIQRLVQIFPNTTCEVDRLGTLIYLDGCGFIELPPALVTLASAPLSSTQLAEP
jgi:hypothetical protein